jgi:signal transduction histidine kinase
VQESKRSVSTITNVFPPDFGQVAVLEAAGLSGVCTDQNLVVIQSFGDTTAYLKNENFNFNLCDLLPEQLSVQIQAAAHHALKLHQRVTLSKLPFTNDTSPNKHSLNIVISPYLNVRTNDQLLLVLFNTKKDKTANKNTIAPPELKQLTLQHLISLEMELAEAKDNLEEAYKLNSASDENIQSFNEELQSANEEMQSANEELQSVNEELRAINKQQHDTNAELAESNDSLNNYFSSNTNGQLFVDNDLLLKKYSPGAVKLINLLESDLGRPLAHITTNIKHETLTADIKQVMLDGITITREAESFDGKIYQVMTMPYVLKNDHRTVGAIVSFYEITELKQLLTELDIGNKKLNDSVIALELSKEKVSESLEKEKNLNLLKTRFVSMASHEFKTPLTSIQLSAELIEKVGLKLDHPIIKKCTKTIKNASKNLADILNNFLSIEMLETGNTNPVLYEFNVVTFARDLVEDMRSLAKHDQKIVFRHTGQGQMVTLNQSLLKNCIINLISNAIKYSGPDSIIEFCTRTNNKYLTLIISDNGIGIPEEDQKHMFEAFFRAQNTGDMPGTGLGLNIVTRYTALMKGKIRFKSQVNEGTAFTIVFPIRPDFLAKTI